MLQKWKTAAITGQLLCNRKCRLVKIGTWRVLETPRTLLKQTMDLAAKIVVATSTIDLWDRYKKHV